MDTSKRDTNPPRHSVHFFNDRPGDNGSQLTWLDYPLEVDFDVEANGWPLIALSEKHETGGMSAEVFFMVFLTLSSIFTTLLSFFV